MSKYKFPQSIFVIIDSNSDLPPRDSLIAYSTPEQAVEGDGPTVIAEYELKGTPHKYIKKLADGE